MLQIKNFTITSKETKARLLDKVSFEVGKNEIHCVLGKNGSGKTTLAYAVMGLDRYTQTSGKILFFGKDISKKKTFERARMGISLAFQEPARFEGLTVRDFLEISKPQNHSLSADKLKSKVLRKDQHTNTDVKAVLELVGLDESFLDRKLDEKLSGGERKRIELASVIMMRPKLMILDEPDASLDIIVYNELYDLMLKIKKEIGCSILLITHREEAGLIADKATLLVDGKGVLTGRFRKVMREYCTRMGARERCMVTKKGILNSEFRISNSKSQILNSQFYEQASQ